MHVVPLPLTALLLAGCLQRLEDHPETGQTDDSDADADADTDTDTDADADADADVDCGGAAVPMAGIAGGTFTMGSPDREVGRADDEDEHRVTLSHDFCLGTTEVTQAQWFDVTAYLAAYFDDCGELCPVESITWHEAAAFANLLSTAEHLTLCYSCTGSGPGVRCTPEGDPYHCDGYRLPTEAEWERAARAGSTAAFSDGGELPAGSEVSCDANLQLTTNQRISDFAWWCGNDTDSTHNAAALSPFPAGLYDMGGNVMEWCHDGYGAYTGDATDPVGSLGATRKVLRGGSFASYAPSLRTAGRHAIDGDTSNYIYGFRVARTAWR